MIMSLDKRGQIFRLDIGTMEDQKAPVVRRLTSPGSVSVQQSIYRLFLHETDFISLLQGMKSF